MILSPLLTSCCCTPIYYCCGSYNWPQAKKIGPQLLQLAVKKSRSATELPTTNKNTNLLSKWLDYRCRYKKEKKKSKEENATTTKYKKPFSNIQRKLKKNQNNGHIVKVHFCVPHDRWMK